MCEPLSLDQFGQLALRCAPTVAPSTLASIAETESRLQPLTINDNTTGTSGVPETRAIAVQIASRLLEAGHSVDLGVMQINSANLGRVGLTADSAFDPCRSIAAAAAILTSDYAGGDTHAAQQAAVRDAISAYNTGDARRGFLNGYVHKVELAARQIVPALDVDAAASPSARPVSAAPASPSYTNAPPSWDVWAPSGDAQPRFGAHDANSSVSDPGGAVIADAASGPNASGVFPDQETSKVAP